jgi:hypothetical protein
MMNRVAAASVGLCAALYIAISAFCLADFGSSVLPNLLLNYRFQSRDENDNIPSPRDSTMQVATAAMAVAVILAYPLNIFPARVTLIGLLDQQKGSGAYGCYPPETDNATTNGVDDDNNDDVGTTTNTTLANGKRGRANANLTQALLQDLAEERAETAARGPGGDENHNDGDYCGDGPANTTTTTANGGPRVTSTNGHHHYSNGHHHYSNGNGVAPPSPPTTSLTTPPFHWQQHVVVTLFLTGTSLALALIIPDIKVLFGLLGGTASSIIGFCIPGLLGLQLSKDLLNDHHGNNDDTGTTTVETARRTRIVSWCLLVGGALVGAVTTVATIYEIALTHRRP